MESTAALDLGPFLINKFGDRTLYPVNRDSFQKLGTSGTYLDYFGPSYFKESTLYLIVGSDSGALIKYIEQIGVPDGARMLIVELPEVLTRIPEVLDLDSLDSRIAVVPFAKMVEQAAAFNAKDYFYSNNIFLVKALCSADAFLPAYHQLYDAIKEQMEALRWKISLSLGGVPFIIRQLQNLAENRIPAECLQNSFGGKTAVVLGGGPSLDEVLPWAKANRERVVILAASRICKRLLEVGLEPHMVISIDPHAASFDVSREMLHFWNSALFVHNYHVTPLLLGQWRGRSAFLGSRFPWKTPLNPEPLRTSGPTVTHVAVGLAIEMGCSQIVLGGVDLCFSSEGYTHAQGTTEREAGPNLAEVSVWVDTNAGEKAATIHPFAFGIQMMGQAARYALSQGCRIVNPAPGAAKIPYVEHLTLDVLDLPAAERTAEEILAERLPVEDRMSRQEHYRRMLNELARGKKGIAFIRDLAGEALEANAGLFGRDGKKASFKYKKRMDRIEKKIQKAEGGFAKLVKVYGIQGFLKTVRPDRQEWTDEEVERVGKTYYQAYRVGAKSLLALLEKIEQKLLSRLDEESDSPDFDSLADQWRSDQQIGRVQVWRTRNSESSAELPPASKELLQALEDEFSRLLTAGEDVCPAYDRRKVDFKGARAKARLFFGRKEQQKLALLLEGISRHSGAEVEPLLHLVRGFLAELDGNPDHALAEYEALVGGVAHPAIEDALVRVAAITRERGDLQETLMAFECLAGISPVYAPKYAELLRLMGENRRALEVYADYLDNVPHDLATALKIGRFYQELNVAEGARVLYRYVLEKDPKNSTARELLVGLDEQPAS